ncbi:hypothetical protein CIPAW_15G106600 [Carya illinoinensis]|uniref:Senescence-associated protein n=1 Tax=Carya illinoinensis TaxID=32201 RepID=A0A8T1NE73_CARIL|nr:hypothetical protein CIPAW_15G106600 [Carya illinoinensis]
MAQLKTDHLALTSHEGLMVEAMTRPLTRLDDPAAAHKHATVLTMAHPRRPTRLVNRPAACTARSPCAGPAAAHHAQALPARARAASAPRPCSARAASTPRPCLRARARPARTGHAARAASTPRPCSARAHRLCPARARPARTGHAARAASAPRPCSARAASTHSKPCPARAASMWRPGARPGPDQATCTTRPCHPHHSSQANQAMAMPHSTRTLPPTPRHQGSNGVHPVRCARHHAPSLVKSSSSVASRRKSWNGDVGKTNLSHDGLNPAHVPYWWVNNPTLGEFCFTMIGRADIEGSKSNVAMNAWLPQASYPCGNFSDTSGFKFRRSKGSIGHAFTVRIRTGNQNQTSFYPFVPHEISVLVELILGHLRYLLTDVPPQPNSPPDNVFRPDRPAETSLGSKKRGNAPPPIHGISKITLKVVVFHFRLSAPTYPTPLKSFHKVGLESSSTGPSPGRHAATRSRRGSSSSSPPTADGFGTGTPVPSPQSQSFSRGYGSILPTSLAYIVPSTRGCSPWRPDAVMSTTGRGWHSVLRIFKGRRGRTGHHAKCGALPAAGPYLRLSRFQGGQACRSHGTFPLFGLQSSHLNICYYHQDLHRRPLRPGSRPRFCSDRRALLLIGAWHLPRRPDERFARQYRCGPPPEFPLASPRSGIVHHLSGPDRYALTRTLLRRSRSVGGATHKGIPPISFLAPYGFTSPLTRTHVRLLGPCFKTGRMGCRSTPCGACCPPRSRQRRLHGHDYNPGLGRRRNPHRSTPRVDRQTGIHRSTSDRGASPAPIRFPPDNFKHSLTLFSKSFSSFPRGTCLLSVSRPYLALDGIYRPIGAAFPNNPTRRQRLVVRQGPGTTGLSPSPAPPSRGLGPGRRALGRMASGATCVQRLDDSRDSAIHTKYRISLRSSSMREPRYPLPRVLFVFHKSKNFTSDYEIRMPPTVPHRRHDPATGITAAAGTRLALQWILVKGFRLYSFQLPDSKATLPLTIPRRIFKSSAKDSTRRSVRIGKTNLSHDGLNPAHVPYWWVNNPTLGEFCFTIIGRADIEGSKSNVAMNAWLPQASYPCGNFFDTSGFKFRRSKGSIGHAFTVRIRTGNQNQTSFYPFVPHEISVLVELILGHLRYLLIDVPPQPNSPPDNVFHPDRPAETSLGSKKRGNAPPPIHRISKITLKVVVFHFRLSAPTYPTPLKSFHKVGLESSSTGPSPGRHAATRSRRGSSSSSPPTADGFRTGTPVPSPQSQSFSRGYGSILPTSLAYIVPSTRGCSPWRPDAVMSTTGRGWHSVLRILNGRRGRTGHHAKCGALPAAGPYLRLSRFQGGQACRSHGTFPLFGLQSSHLNICYYHQDLHRRPLRLGSRPRFCSDRRALLLIGAWHLPRRPDERFARQYRCGPPPEFPLASPRSGIVHHLSGPDRYALTRTLLRRSRSVGGATHKGIPPISFLAPYGFTSPLTRTHVRLLARLAARAARHDRGNDVSTGMTTTRAWAAAAIRIGPHPESIGKPAYTHSLTLFSKSFSSFPRGTCLLSVSRPYLALDVIYRPIGAAFPNNPTRRQRLVVRQGPGTTGLSPSPAPPSRGLGPGPPLRTLLQTTIRMPSGTRFSSWALPGVGVGATMRDTQADVPSAEWLRAQLAFKDSMIRGILQFTSSIAFRYVLHRCESRDIRCRESLCIVVRCHQRHAHRFRGGRGYSLFEFLGADRAGVHCSTGKGTRRLTRHTRGAVGSFQRALPTAIGSCCQGSTLTNRPNRHGVN